MILLILSYLIPHTTVLAWVGVEQRRLPALAAARQRDEETIARETDRLKTALVELQPEGARQTATAEAGRLAREAILGARELRSRYRLVRPPHFHNLLVNLGLKKEGYCWHWTRDLTRRFEELNLHRYVLHWGIAREGTIREHNAVVVTGEGAPFSEGLVIDGWRQSGRLTWTRVSDDHYPWRERD